MKLIEKKCPNCGADLSFNDTDKSCKCDYCKRQYEIERENDDSNQEKYVFNLNEIKTPLKIFGYYFLGTYIVGAIIAIIAFIIIAVVGYNIYKSSINHTNSNHNDSIIKEEVSNKYYSSVDEIDNSDYEDIDGDANMEIDHTGKGVNDANHTYTRDGSPKREKIYVASKKDGNMIVVIYKVNYKDFFHQENHYTVYVPILYENIKNTNSIMKFKNPQIKAPEYYFDSEKKSYTYGYKSLEDAYNDLIKPLKDDYKISEK